MRDLYQNINAIELLFAIISADGVVRNVELNSFHEQIRLLCSMDKNRFSTNEYAVEFANRYEQYCKENSAAMPSLEEIENKARGITDKKLQLSLLEACFEVAYCDDEYHEMERAILDILKRTWNI